MRLSSIERALEAMRYMEKGKPYGLREDEGKRKLADELARICAELGISPVIIGGMAVNHHGYRRFTEDVDLLMTEADALALLRQLKRLPHRSVRLDVAVAGRRTSPRWEETYPEPSELRSVRVRPLPVPGLADLIALKVKSSRARDDADVVELLKRHPTKIAALGKAAARKLRTPEARTHLDELVARAREELERRG